jgi:phospholipid N-methyltransferase
VPTTARPRPVRDSLKFLGTFLRHPLRVGAVLPSSRFLARALTGGLALKPGDLVVEFGPGTGPITTLLRAEVRRGVRYLGIERDRGFHGILQQRFPEMTFHQGSAEDVARILGEHGLPAPRAIVSGLPFATLPSEAQDRIIAGTLAVLAPGGEFRTFQYVHAYRMAAARRFRKLMAERFHGFRRLGPVLRNVPPAYVLSYRR